MTVSLFSIKAIKVILHLGEEEINLDDPNHHSRHSHIRKLIYIGNWSLPYQNGQQLVDNSLFVVLADPEFQKQIHS